MGDVGDQETVVKHNGSQLMAILWTNTASTFFRYRVEERNVNKVFHRFSYLELYLAPFCTPWSIIIAQDFVSIP